MDIDDVYTLNVFSVILGIFAILIPVVVSIILAQGVTRSRRLAALVLCFFLFLALIGATLCQVRVQIIQRGMVEEGRKLVQAYTEAYSGWIKVGTYDKGVWKELSLPIKEDPSTLVVGKQFIIGSQYAYYVHVHDRKPPRCNASEEWYNKTTINAIGKDKPIIIREVATYKCPKGGTEVWARIEPSTSRTGEK